ncbi:MAG: glycosyltransferase family 4 protein [bacterium]
MNLPLLLTHRAGWGGAELTLLDLFDGLPREEWHVSAAVSPGIFSDRLAVLGADVQRVDFPAWRKGRDLFRNWLCLRAMSRLASSVSARLVIAGDIRTVPYAVRAAEKNNCPCLAFIQDPAIKERHIKAYRVHRADRVICPSKQHLRLVRSGGVKDDRSLLMPVGIDTERFHPGVDGSQMRHEWMLRDDAVIVGCAGSISRLKGQDILLEAILPILEEDRRVQLVFVGSGQQGFIEDLKNQAGTFLESGQIRFVEWQEDIPAVLAAMDVIVVPSRSESFSRATAEAMASGKPVVATQTGAIEELLDCNQCGLSVPVENPQALREALRALLSNPDLRTRLGNAGAERIRQSFALRDMQRSFREIVQSLCLPLAHESDRSTSRDAGNVIKLRRDTETQR